METNNEPSVNNEITSDSPLPKAEKKTPKKFNGFLRNNNKKQNKKPTPDMHLKKKNYQNPKVKDDNIEPTVPLILEPKQSQEEYEVFNFLRIKTGHNEKKFWENLSTILNQKSFSEIKKSNLSLIAYAVLHDSTIVFDKLLSQFGKEVTQEEFINCIFKYGIHKNPELINSSIEFYQSNFKIDDSFLKQLITDISSISYRFETNQLLLSWICPKMNDELLDLFWKNAIENKNIPIIFQSLEYKTCFQYLKKNIDNYEKSHESIGRFNEIKRALGVEKTFKKVDETKESVIIKKDSSLINTQDFEPKIWLSDKAEQLKVIQENLSDKKPTEVIVKRKRKIA